MQHVGYSKIGLRDGNNTTVSAAISAAKIAISTTITTTSAAISTASWAMLMAK